MGFSILNSEYEQGSTDRHTHERAKHSRTRTHSEPTNKHSIFHTVTLTWTQSRAEEIMVARGGLSALSLSPSFSLSLSLSVSLRQKACSGPHCLLDLITITQLQRTVHSSAQLTAHWHTHTHTHTHILSLTCMYRYTHSYCARGYYTQCLTPLNNCLLCVCVRESELECVYLCMCVFLSFCLPVWLPLHP